LLLGIVALLAAAREQAHGRAQKTGQDEFLHGVSLVLSVVAVVKNKIRNRMAKKSCTGVSANLSHLPPV
jgi:hypothetical protein